MVVLEAAAISAAGYGLYKGGEIGIRKGKEVHKEMKREQNRSVQQSELGMKIKARSERINKIMNMRRGGNSSCEAEPATAATAFSTSAPNLMAPSSNASSSFPSSRVGTTSSSSIEDRHRAVVAKLRAGRREESKKSSSGGVSGGVLKNPFKRK
jgi:hypothetical protein